MGHCCDLLIIGGGPAGLAAATNAASEGLHTCLLTKDRVGGQAADSSLIENYLGFPTGLSGAELAQAARDQAEKFGATIHENAEVIDVRQLDGAHYVTCESGTTFECKSLLVASGVEYTRLNVPGATRLLGKGVHYGRGVGDGIESKGKDIYIVGGANSAGQAAMHFSKFAHRVFVISRSPLEKGMSKYLIDRLTTTENIIVHVGARIAALKGETRLEGLVLAAADMSPEERPASEVFVFIGAKPHTEWAPQLEKDEHGFVCSGNEVTRWELGDRSPHHLESSKPGIFVAGDVRRSSVKRVAAAVGEGSTVVQYVHRYLADR